MDIQVYLKYFLSSSEYLQKYLTYANKLCWYKTINISAPYFHGPIWKAIYLSFHLSIYSFIYWSTYPSFHPPTKSSLSTYHVPSIVLDAEDMVVNEKYKTIFALMQVDFFPRDEKHLIRNYFLKKYNILMIISAMVKNT